MSESKETENKRAVILALYYIAQIAESEKRTQFWQKKFKEIEGLLPNRKEIEKIINKL